MSYRIHLQKINKNSLNEYLKRTEDTFFNESGDLKLISITELNDETPIDDFTFIERFKEEEYKPYLLNKDDFLKLLKYYKNFIFENLSKKEEELKKIIDTRENNILVDRDFLCSIWTNYMYLSNYFEDINRSDKLLKSSGMFMLDYFYLIKEYENINEDELLIITHG